MTKIAGGERDTAPIKQTADQSLIEGKFRNEALIVDHTSQLKPNKKQFFV